jgi:aromatic ring-opening dioxygenase catalytic subunit (LigB family)
LNPEIGVGHAFVFMYEYMLPNGDIAMVPVMINTFFPPNQPAPQRCYALGQALRRAIDAWDSDKTIAIVASGGLSHTIMDEGIDHMTIDGVMEKDAEALRTLPRERLNLGTSEIRNWIAIAGAMEAETPHMIGEYIPAYRSPAGTGCGIAFTYWE